jgi:hypothetical protein
LAKRTILRPGGVVDEYSTNEPRPLVGAPRARHHFERTPNIFATRENRSGRTSTSCGRTKRIELTRLQAATLDLYTYDRNIAKHKHPKKPMRRSVYRHSPAHPLFKVHPSKTCVLSAGTKM